MGRKRGSYEDKPWMHKPRAFGNYGPTRPKAIFFDVDDTLVDRTGAFARYFEALMARFPSVFPEHRRAEDFATIQSFDERGGRDRDAFCLDVTKTFSMGISAKELWTDFRMTLPGLVGTDPKLVEWMTALAKRHPVVTVSNGFAGTQRMKLLRAGLYHTVPEGFFSSEVGVEKPDPRIFLTALEHVRREPAEVLHVGDDPERDIVGAAKVGITTCWVSHGRPWPQALPPPTFTVERITSRVEDFAQVLSTWT
ncbi:HAD family hydrolase [Myxococcus landrumensis]|nr:HAD family hydrolase [Myxococcus landrumus]